MLRDQRLELADQIGVSSQRKIGRDPFLERHQPALLEPRDRGLREGLEREVRERRSAPQRERLPKQPTRLLSPIRLVKGTPSLCEQPLELVEVEAPRLEAELVTGAPRDQQPIPARPPVALERPAQAGDVIPDCLRRGRWSALAPELVHEAIGRDDLVRIQDQQRQERTLPPAAKGNDSIALESLERAKDPKLHRLVLTLTPSLGSA